MLAKLWPFVTRRRFEAVREAAESFESYWHGERDRRRAAEDALMDEAARRKAAEKAADDLFDRLLEAVAEADTAIDLGEKAVEIGEERAREICDLRAELAVADELAGILESQRDAAQERAAEADREARDLASQLGRLRRAVVQLPVN
jgi:hypothetical protein